MVNQLTAALLDGDSDTAFERIQDLYKQGTPIASIYQNYITEAMRSIGQLWEDDSISVADEHLATSTCDYILARFHSTLRIPKLTNTSKKAMFFCVENEQHSLGMKMAAHLFEQAGWNVRMMGANLPLSHAYKAAERFEPDVIAISLTIIHHLGQLKDYVTMLEQVPNQPHVIVGSRLLSSYDLAKYASPKTRMIGDYESLQRWMVTLDEVDVHEFH
jgi:MerR family transcriptional regulator, light-induced transcriptional regulator